MKKKDKVRGIEKENLEKILSPIAEVKLPTNPNDTNTQLLNVVYSPFFIFKSDSVTNQTTPRFENLIYQMESRDIFILVWDIETDNVENMYIKEAKQIE